MDFKNISSKFYPAYTWFWNNTITREGIDRQIDEMVQNGIRAFYVIGEPDNWFPMDVQLIFHRNTFRMNI